MAMEVIRRIHCQRFSMLIRNRFMKFQLFQLHPAQVSYLELNILQLIVEIMKGLVLWLLIIKHIIPAFKEYNYVHLG